MQIPNDILKLIKRFEQNYDEYRLPSYNETQVRRDFIDPFFNCLGWDMDNSQGLSEIYREVKHEYRLYTDIKDVPKAPDYCFLVAGERKFFTEAKKPAINLKSDPKPAFQLRRYAWSAKLPVSILTDFEEFVIYDCRVMPKNADEAIVCQILYLSYKEYPDRWEEIYNLFSREAVLAGSLDKYAETLKTKKGTTTVDTAFLQEISNWREMLAHNIAAKNPDLNQRELNIAVQLTIDRLIFLRICEDRGVENYKRLLKLCDSNSLYENLCDVYRQADDRYNSGLFHFQQEKDRLEPPDEFTLKLKIDDDPLSKIITSLYYPNSPYAFSVITVEILGQAYEQFLGKVITISTDHTVSVEEKPEVRKAGGVYYTPIYIVDAIIERTIGEFLKGKTPKQASKLKILDPSCGSGSFLIGAYQCIGSMKNGLRAANKRQS
ncbi:MAG: N-6 DNA methylase [Blastocatellia bacterium]|nr:N-6 DNA methylase [Blastocatellia bacterium]